MWAWARGFSSHLPHCHLPLQVTLTDLWPFSINEIAQSIWMQQPHSTHAHSTAFTAHTDYSNGVVVVHACAIQSTLLGYQVTSVSCKPFLLYWQWLDLLQTDFIYLSILISLLSENMSWSLWNFLRFFLKPTYCCMLKVGKCFISNVHWKEWVYWICLGCCCLYFN